MGFFKHISARRAWHDCFYVRNITVMNQRRSAEPLIPARIAGIEKHGNQSFLRVFAEPEENETRQRVSYCVPMMNAKDERRAAKDFFLAWDPIWRGRVQASIRSLSNRLQAFGMIMYAPADEMSDRQVELVHAAVIDALYGRLAAAEVSRWHARKAIRIQYLVYTALRYYRDLVFGGGPTLGGPVAIDNYLYRNFGERLPSARKNWYRDWQPLWDIMVDIMNDMERETLAPVSQVLAELREIEEAA